MKTYQKVKSRPTRNRLSMTVTSISPLKSDTGIGVGGYTLVEMLVTVTIVGILVSLAIPAFTQYKNMAKISRATSEIRSIVDQIAFYQTDRINLPPNLDALPSGIARKDPWGGEYIYYILPADNSGAYRDMFNLPLNAGSGFDIYSKGADGQTTNRLLDDAANYTSMDDIVLCADGSMVELGERY